MRRRNATPLPGHIGSLLQLLLSAALACPLLGCAPPDPDAPFDIYSGLLGRALGAPAPAPLASALPPLPGPRDPQSADSETIAAATAGIDILELAGCALKTNLIRSRSVLGRYARPSQRLLLTLEYLRLAPPCIARLREQGRDSLADSIRRGLTLRRERLAALLFEATLGSDEYRNFWQPDSGLRVYPHVAHDDVIAALNGINTQGQRWLAGDDRAENLAFELQLGAVAGGGGGALLGSLSRQADWLAAADRLLREQLARSNFCDDRVRAAATVEALVAARRYFELELRHRIAAPAQRARALLTAITALETLLEPTLPLRYRRWRALRIRHTRWREAAPARHLDLLGRAIATCRRLEAAPSPSD